MDPMEKVSVSVNVFKESVVLKIMRFIYILFYSYQSICYKINKIYSTAVDLFIYFNCDDSLHAS